MVGTIPYGGEYGTVTNQICHIDNRVGEMSVSPRSGITTNAQLGFLRTQGVKHFLQHYVEPLSRTNNSYEYYVVQRKEKGAQYRRVAIEIIIHDVQ